MDSSLSHSLDDDQSLNESMASSLCFSPNEAC